MNKFLELDCAKKKNKIWSYCKLRKLRKFNMVLPITTTTKNVQFVAFLQKIWTNTYKKTNGASSLKFTYPSWVVDTSWGRLIY